MSKPPDIKRNKLNHAIVTALAATAVNTPANAQIEEIIVTATKRAASTQDIPVAISALRGDDLQELRISNFDDYVRYLPNVVSMGTGPGESELYIRGAATEQSKKTVSAIQGASPAVALYLDEQPVSFGGRNLDVYATDLDRVEVLPGPQGTLFGASSQSGTVRLITNKPVQGEFEAGASVDVSTTRGGDVSHSQQAYLNMPIRDDLALRIAAYHDEQAGWLDNVSNLDGSGNVIPGGRRTNDGGLIAVINRNDISAAPVHPDSTFDQLDNSALAEEDFNDARYVGGRFSLAYQPTDDFSLLVQHTQQSLETDGVFAYDPNLEGRSRTSRFTPEASEDDFGLTTLTLNGRIGMLDAIYTVGYLDREMEAMIDYSGYSLGGGYQVYYLCEGVRDFGQANGFEGYGGTTPVTSCYDSQGRYEDETDSKRITQEFRVSMPDEYRMRVTAGAFFDEQTTRGTGAFGYTANRIPGDEDGSWPALGLTIDAREGASRAGRQFAPDINFVNDFTRKTEQLALFGQVDFDLTPTVTASFGARWYDIDFDFKGTTNSSFLCKFGTDGCDVDAVAGDANFNNHVTARLRALGQNTPESLSEFFGDGAAAVATDIAAGRLNVDDLDDDGVLNASDVIFRASLDWQVTDDILLFTTFGQGFRPPITNRNAAQGANNPYGQPQYDGYRVPAIALTDDMENYEWGIKADLFDRTLRVNATGYYSEITDLQVSRFDPANVAFLVFVENVGDAEVIGVDSDFTWAPTANLTIAGAFSIIDTELTRINEQLVDIAVPAGSELPFTPDFSGNLRARYEFDLPVNGGSLAYISAGLSYTGESKSGITGSAYHIENTLELVTGGAGSGLSIADEGEVFAGGNCGTYDNLVNCRNGRYIQDDYVLLDLAVGLQSDTWGAELYVDNVTDKRAQLHVDTLQYVPKVVTNRPRSFGIRFSYDYN
ncbi:MAG: TonB-dependent receptor [Gammaproteobacteria bacterium]|nr:TonB-dependent receptor [Gammaproteobacteria bacterium]MCY4282363.1 TonB-dependent receptor [Gammaproteobacteria bacterium]MCY4339438.1 TonB-dependent receptor [Gammaproteobacteria bacterium]